MAKYAKVVKQSIGNETYYAFRTGKQGNRPASICGHYTTPEAAEIAAKAYRSGKPASRLVCEQTKKLIK